MQLCCNCSCHMLQGQLINDDVVFLCLLPLSQFQIEVEIMDGFWKRKKKHFTTVFHKYGNRSIFQDSSKYLDICNTDKLVNGMKYEDILGNIPVIMGEIDN